MSLTTDLRTVIAALPPNPSTMQTEADLALDRIRTAIDHGAVMLFPNIEDAAERIMTLEARNASQGHMNAQLSATLDKALQRIHDLEWQNERDGLLQDADKLKTMTDNASDLDAA